MNLNSREVLTLTTALEMLETERRYPCGYHMKTLKAAMPNLLKEKLICVESLKYCGVLELNEKGINEAKKLTVKGI